MSNDFEQDALDQIEQLLAELEDADHELQELPAGLWEDIEAAAFGESRSVPQNVRVADRQPNEPEPFVYDQEAAAEKTASKVIAIDSKRFSARAMPGLAIAAAAVVVAGMVGILLSRSTDEADVLASAQLAYLDDFDPIGANADALVVLVNDGGERLIKIDNATLPDPGGEDADLELWLIEPDADGQVADLVSLGIVDPSNPGEFSLPEGLDPDVFFVVDISVEPRDGVETHSGRSILRGPLSDT